MKASYRAILIALASLVLLAALGQILLAGWVRQQIRTRAAKAQVEIGTVSVNIFTRSASISNVHWSSTSSPAIDSVTGASIEKLTISGLKIYQLIKDKRISLRAVIAENGRVLIKHTPARERVAVDTLKITGIQIESLQLINTAFSVESDSLTTWTGTATLTLGMVTLVDPEDPFNLSSYEVSDIGLDVDHVSMSKINGYNDLKIGHLKFDKHQKTLVCDSVTVTPRYSKLDYARKKGTQSTWATVSIPRIIATGLDLQKHLDSTFTASNITLEHARINAFRDKRIPLLRKSSTPMPMAWFRNLGYAIEIDSITVSDMRVVYEHVAENSTTPGLIRFEKLNGLFLNANNREYDNLPQVTTLAATGLIMGKGEIRAHFNFPLAEGSRYQARGSVRGLPLASLNRMLENAVFVSIESGNLNELDFQFSYDNEISDGTVTIDYDNLKIKGLKRDHKSEKDQLKSLIANIAIRNTLVRGGTIHTERDKRRFIFQYWAQSLLDGIQDAVVPAAPERKAK